jgi:hypothetical protein
MQCICTPLVSVASLASRLSHPKSPITLFPHSQLCFRLELSVIFLSPCPHPCVLKHPAHSQLLPTTKIPPVNLSAIIPLFLVVPRPTSQVLAKDGRPRHPPCRQSPPIMGFLPTDLVTTRASCSEVKSHSSLLSTEVPVTQTSASSFGRSGRTNRLNSRTAKSRRRDRRCAITQ